MKIGQFTEEEISSQGNVWSTVLQKFDTAWNRQKGIIESVAGHPIIVTGCGSTYYLSLSVAAIFRHHGFDAQAYSSSDVATFPNSTVPKNAWLLAISRSGKTSETLWAVKRFRDLCPDGKVIAVTCEDQSDLVSAADFCFTSPEAREKSVVQTRSFTSMLLLSQLLVASLIENQHMIAQLQKLPYQLRLMLDQNGDLPYVIGADLSFQRLFFLGGGPFYGLACEAMLKVKEMTLSWSESYHPLEIRHGPMSVVDKQSLVIALMSDSGFEAERSVLRDMKNLGARVMAITEDGSSFGQNEVDNLVEFHSGLSEWERGPLYLPVLHWIFYYRALSCGQNPDEPMNLTAVVELN